MPLMNTYICFSQMECFPDYIFSYDRLKNVKTRLLWVLKKKKKKLLPELFSVKLVMLPARSVVLGNWFACVPDCTSAIARVSLTSVRSQLVKIRDIIDIEILDVDNLDEFINNTSLLKIPTGKKHPKIKLQLLRKRRVLTFGLLVY